MYGNYITRSYSDIYSKYNYLLKISAVNLQKEKCFLKFSGTNYTVYENDPVIAENS